MADVQSTETEEWRDVVGLEGRYRVSSFGRVMSARGKVLAQSTLHGYQYIALNKAQYRVHRLVLAAFVGPCPEGHVAAHWNGVRSDNHVANLRWTTKRDNETDKERHGTILRGESHTQAKLSTVDVLEIRRLHGEGASSRTLGRQFNVNACTIMRIVRRQKWAHVQ